MVLETSIFAARPRSYVITNGSEPIRTAIAHAFNVPLYPWSYGTDSRYPLQDLNRDAYGSINDQSPVSESDRPEPAYQTGA